jgi:hypothetical protein
METQHLKLAKQIADLFAPLTNVEAVALAGSRGRKTNTPDDESDIDLYVYTSGKIPLETRLSIVERSGGASRLNLDMNFWGPDDEWFNAPSGIEVDIIYFDKNWMEEQIRRVVELHIPSLGYTTCLWYTLSNSTIFSDQNAWFSSLQNACPQAYPEELRHNIISHNHPVLRGIIPAYRVQIEKAIKRSDQISINHRLAGLFASYFDILFALNRKLHPGEKRLVEFALNNCKSLPDRMQEDIHTILQTSTSNPADLLVKIDLLLDRLDQLLIDEGFTLSY